MEAAFFDLDKTVIARASMVAFGRPFYRHGLISRRLLVRALSLLMLFSFVSKMYRKAGPNEAFIVYGLGGTRVIKGGGTLVFPMVQSYRSLSLELMSFDVAPQQDLYTKQGVAVTVEAVAQIKVKSDGLSIATAA